MTSTEQTTLDRKKKFLLVLPLIAAPFLFIAFYALGGGQGDPGKGAAEKAAGMGFNTELPAPVFAKKEKGMDKMAAYEQAKRDSMRRREALRQDPYRSGSRQDPAGGNWLSGSFNPMNAQLAPGNHLNTQLRPEDRKADELLQKLEQLQKGLAQPGKMTPGAMGKHADTVPQSPIDERPAILMLPKRDTPHRDPELDRLSSMLDKIVAIQHGNVPGLEEEEGQVRHAASGAGQRETGTVHETAAATIPAVVQGDQGLVNGATIALRLTAEISIGGVRIPRDQLVYGQVAISNDRMMVHIGSIRSGQSIYLMSLQLYDLDGLPGIHIPDMLTRQVARQSADQGISSLNLGAYDPSIGAQATNAGIQAAKSLFSRKVRLVRVSVRDGYRVLLKDTKGAAVMVIPRDTVVADRKDVGGEVPAVEIQAPPMDSLEIFMHHSVKEGRIRLTLQGIYLQDGLMWLSFECSNRSKIGYVPDHLRCTIREGRRLKRMAVQEIPLEPVYQQAPPVIAGDSSGKMLLCFRPFTLGKGKKLLVQIGEREGGRGLEMEISPKVLLHAK